MIRLSTVMLALSLTLSVMLAPLPEAMAGEARGKTDRPPDSGGYTQSLGMPPIWKGHAGFEGMWYRPSDVSKFAGLVNLGLMRDLGSPVVGVAGLGFEGYAGMRNTEFDGGGRAMFLIPNFRLGAGVDFNIRDESLDFVLGLGLPIRRGGVVGGGSNVVVRWIPARGQTFSVGIDWPLWGSNMGKTRAKTDYVRLDSRKPRRVQKSQTFGDMDQTLATVRARALWIARMTQPFTDVSGADPHKAMAPVLDTLRGHWSATDELFPDGHTLVEEIRVYHEALDRAFTIALAGESAPAQGSSEIGRRASAQARRILLEEVLTAYNYDLGQRKKDDSLIGLIALAQTRFAHWLLSDQASPDLSAARRAFWVYQSLCDFMEENRKELKGRWEDSHFVWLPLQYALKPEQHDSHDELTEIVALASRDQFSEGNRVWYIINEEFQWEVARSVQQAEEYHVLWIHDIRGVNGQKKPDAISYVQVLTYLQTLTQRVKDYDKSGPLPTYMIFLDQHYFELNKSRIWLRLLRDPLDYELDLPAGYDKWEEQLKAVQTDLRRAVEESVLLRVERSQFGEKWLKNRIKVHVNITNPADPSFVSLHVAGILPIPDSMMRDHRKIAFFDVTEEDPYRGAAIFTGMGIGEHYVGANWEDRAIMVQGPEALETKRAAYHLLLNQGFAPDEIPFPLRPKPLGTGYHEAVERYLAQFPEWLGHRGEVLQLHNQTGFRPKPINAAKATLYSLMPAGSLLKVPDSLWQSYIYASLLSGSALRGCRVMIIAPTGDSAPSAAPPTLARAHGLMGRLIAFSNGMGEEIQSEAGLLRVGLYAPRQGVGDLAGRFEQALANNPEWARSVYPINAAFEKAVANTRAQLDSLGYSISYLAGADSTIQPKMHLKANLFASGVGWDKLVARPEWAGVFRQYVNYLAEQNMNPVETGEIPDIRNLPVAMREEVMNLLENFVADLSEEEKEELILFMTVGSVNMDYRSMVMDGEAMIILAGWQGIHGLIDFILLAGLAEWPETTEELDQLLAPPGGFTRSMAGLMKLSL